MNLIDRAKAILSTPKEEWEKIDAEPLDLSALLTRYVIPLALISPIAFFIRFLLFGFQEIPKTMVAWAISYAMVMFVSAIVGPFILASSVNAWAPVFGATRNMPQAIKLAAYGMTAAMVYGIFYLIPWLGILTIVGMGYTLYHLFLGLPILMKPPADKTVAYAITVFVTGVVLIVATRFAFRS